MPLSVSLAVQFMFFRFQSALFGSTERHQPELGPRRSAVFSNTLGRSLAGQHLIAPIFGFFLGDFRNPLLELHKQQVTQLRYGGRYMGGYLGPPFSRCD